VPVILAGEQPEDARRIIGERAAQLGCPLVETSEAYRVENLRMEAGCVRAKITETATGWWTEIAPQLPGRFQLQNALNALAAARVLVDKGLHIPESAIASGIAHAVWPGRIEKLQSNPDVYLDGAHNPSAAQELANFLRENFAGRTIRMLFAAMRDKAVDEIAGTLFPLATEVIFTEPRNPRAISAPQLAEIVSHHAAQFRIIPDAETALETALRESARGDAIFITGSLFLVGQLRPHWKNRVQTPRCD
jgi:dihydrofolate synthase / folylpolyglutamate synthase